MSQTTPRKGYKSLFLNKYSIIKANDYAEDWDFIELGNPKSGVFLNGVNKNKEDYGQGCLFVNISDVFREFTINPKKLKRVKVSEKEIEQYRLIKGDLVLDRSSNIYETVGYPSFFNGADEPVVFSGFTFRYRPNYKIWNSKFLTLQLMSSSIRKLVLSIGTKSANSNVNQKSYKKICIPNPPLLEQEKIVGIISNIDDLIINTKKIIDQTKSLKKGWVQKLFTKGINHKKFKKVKWFFGKKLEIPTEWNVISLKDISHKILDGEHISPKFTDSGIPYLSSQHIKSNISFKKCKYVDTKTYSKILERINPEYDDILITVKGTIGFCKRLDINEKFCTDRNVGLIKPDKKNIDPIFLEEIMISSLVQNQILSLVDNNVIPSLYLNRIKKIMILVPPMLKEQQKISTILSNIESQIQSQIEFKEKLERLKKSLTQKLLTGEIRVG